MSIPCACILQRQKLFFPYKAQAKDKDNKAGEINF